MIALELLGAAWESVTLGELALGLGIAGGGATSVVVARVLVRALQATTRALEVWTRHLEASTAAARATARLAPLQGALLRQQLGDRGVDVPAEDESDELQVLRVAAEGDDAELERAAELLARLPEGATLPTSLARAVGRLVKLEADARRRRDADAPKPRERAASWLSRRAKAKA